MIYLNVLTNSMVAKPPGAATERLKKGSGTVWDKHG